MNVTVENWKPERGAALRGRSLIWLPTGNAKPATRRVLPGQERVKPMTLKWSLVTKGMRPHEQLKAKLQQKITKLEAHLAHFPPDAVHLQVNLGRHSKREWFNAALKLRVPSNVLHAEKFGADPVPVFDQAVKALLREVASLKSELRRESDWKRSSADGRLPQIRAPRLAEMPAIAAQA
jgi:ribosome-associated translation inhibitor RaiA